MPIRESERRLVTLVWLLGLLGVWQLIALWMQLVVKDPMGAAKAPYPHRVLMTVIENFGSLLEAGAVTFSRAAIGFALGTLIGIVLAVAMSLSKTLEKIAFPYLIVSQMIPVLGLAPIIFNIVRDMNMSRILIAAYITFFPVAVNMLGGLKSVEQDKKELLYTVAASKFKIYQKLMFPYAMSHLFTGLKIAAPLAVTASILVDMLGSKSGIGVKILYSLYSNRVDIFWASVVTSAVMGILSYYIVILGEWLLLPWKHIQKKKAGD